LTHSPSRSDDHRYGFFIDVFFIDVLMGQTFIDGKDAATP